MTIDSCRCEKRVVYSQDSSACVEPASITIYGVGSTSSDDDQHKIVVYRQFYDQGCNGGRRTASRRHNL